MTPADAEEWRRSAQPAESMTIEVIGPDAREVRTLEVTSLYASCRWDIGGSPFGRYDQALWGRRMDACPSGWQLGATDRQASVTRLMSLIDAPMDCQERTLTLGALQTPPEPRNA